MATPSKAAQPAKRAYSRSQVQPKYPYTPKPGSLRKFLQMAPTKPRPGRITTQLLKTWGFTSSNDIAILRVMKSLGLLGSDGSTTDLYAGFMQKGTGPRVLGARIKIVYPQLFESFADPRAASVEELTNFFNIHSGGSEKTIEYQVQTLKALADAADFDEEATPPAQAGDASDAPMQPSVSSGRVSGMGLHIDLHVHLPENKSKIEYDAIFESIAQHILGKKG